MQLHRSSTAWRARQAGSSAAARSRPLLLLRRAPPLLPPRCAAPEAQVASAEPLSVSIPTGDARSCIRFAVVPSGTGQAIAVQAVAEGSAAEEAGIVRGMRLRGISDPVRRDEVWELQDRPSLRYVRDVLRMRAAPFIELRFEAAPTPEVLAALEAAEGTVPLAASSSASNASNASSSSFSASPADSPLSSLASMSEAGGETIAERLQQQYAASQAGGKAVSAVEQREARRRERMELDSARNDSGFFALVAAAFLLPALIILTIAYASGYLDNLYLNTLSNYKG